MAVVVAAPVEIGLDAEAGHGGAGGEVPLEVAGNEVLPPVEGVPVADILLVGDGDFSFSLALATAFGSGANLVATSLDTYEDLKDKYSKAESNLTELKRLGATLLHGVDTKKMKLHPDLKNRRFDRIIFNLPHAGFKGKEDDLYMINSHRELVWGFFNNALHLLRPYCKIHINHKTGGAYDRWEFEDLASEVCLVLVEKVAFRQEDYPRYNQKRGDSARCDEAFDLGTCFTFKFRIRDYRKKLNENMTSSISFLGTMTQATERGPFHLFPPDEAWPRQHLPPPLTAVHMPIALEPYGVAQRQYPDFRLNFDGKVRDPHIHQQGNTQPMIRTPKPSLRALPDPGGTIPPPMSRIPCPDLLAPEEPWYRHKPTADAPGRDHSCLPWEHQSLHREFQRGLQREREMQGQVMPAATSLSHLALLERQQSYREFVRKERLRRVVALYGCMQ
ncbi:uncharacterized protein C2845_PM04G19270 [Panicum miliaceum]|uniref:25S rRNA (uridine-N(3))-methyltransferase BMT5-like domain-containing protein n=1 Tax=Panicum miliaceum TaxID=4540 RepID=A0A3L6QQN9_PANMI|nr:uncharacterized protein C2845_PM04G19270 [Panicum miliaceum]